MPIPLGVFATAGAGGVPNSYEWISTTTLSSNGSFAFSSLPNTYAAFQVRFVVRDANSGTWGALNIRLNGDAGASYRTNTMVQSGSGVSGTTYIGQQTAGSDTGIIGNTADANNWSVGSIDIPNATKSQSLVRAIQGRYGGMANTSSGGAPAYMHGSWYSSAAVSSISIWAFAFGNFVAGSRASIYGIKADL